MSALVNSFPLWITFSNFKRFCFWLTFSWDMCGRGKQEQEQLLSCQRKMDTGGRCFEEKEESIVLLLTLKALK